MSAVAWMLGLSVALCWLPVVGPFLAGWAGGRRLRRPSAAFFAALIPAALWWGLFAWASQNEFKIGGQSLVLGPLRWLGPLTAAALIGGALVGSEGRGTSLLGGLLLLIGLAWFVPKARQVWSIAQEIRAGQARYEPAKNITCPDHLKRLYDATRLYADSWDGYLPPAERWMTALTDEAQRFAEAEWLHCPDVSRSGEAIYGYAMNAALGGKRLDEVEDKERTPLFYDSTDLRKDAHDAVASLPTPGRHTGRNNVVYLDGKVEAVAPE